MSDEGYYYTDEPFIPFYKPYGMSDEEYEMELYEAKQRHYEWVVQQELTNQRQEKV